MIITAVWDGQPIMPYEKSALNLFLIFVFGIEGLSNFRTRGTEL
jgi:hypothetical protein